MAIGIFSWIVFCFVAGAVGNNRKIGFAGAFFLSLFLSPLLGLFITFNSDKKLVSKQLSPTLVRLIKEGDSLWKNNKIEQAIEKYEEALKYSEKAPLTNFKLSRLYSLKKDRERALVYLASSIRDGYKDFEKINSNMELAYLRETDEYKEFVRNQYKLPTIHPEKTISESRVDKLEKLNTLFEKGVLTKEEFEVEKKHILSSRS